MVDFDPCCRFRFVVIMIDNSLSWNVLLFSGHPIGQLCLGGPSSSSHTVIHGMLQCSDDISVVRVLFVTEPAMVEPTVTASLDWTQTQLGWCLMHNTGHLLRLHSLCIPKGGQMIFGGSWNFLKRKGGMVKISEGKKVGCQYI